jgi:hypothetical protein
LGYDDGMERLILKIIGAAAFSLLTTGLLYYLFVYLDPAERRKRRCPHCDANLRGVKSDVCPRCGRRRH